MKPVETGERYDRLAARWRDETPSEYGLAALVRAIQWTPHRGWALDVGCGSAGRFLEKLRAEGFQTEGLDVSARMVALARERSPLTEFVVADISEWEPARSYALITAWDSTFHLPLASQRPVMEKLVAALAPGGVLLFTCGGGAEGEITGSFWGEDFAYSTLGVETFVDILRAGGCFCRHVEYDQFPENHVAIIAQKAEPSQSCSEQGLI